MPNEESAHIRAIKLKTCKSYMIQKQDAEIPASQQLALPQRKPLRQTSGCEEITQLNSDGAGKEYVHAVTEAERKNTKSI